MLWTLNYLHFCSIFPWILPMYCKICKLYKIPWTCLSAFLVANVRQQFFLSFAKCQECNLLEARRNQMKSLSLYTSCISAWLHFITNSNLMLSMCPYCIETASCTYIKWFTDIAVRLCGIDAKPTLIKAEWIKYYWAKANGWYDFLKTLLYSAWWMKVLIWNAMACIILHLILHCDLTTNFRISVTSELISSVNCYTYNTMNPHSPTLCHFNASTWPIQPGITASGDEDNL